VVEGLGHGLVGSEWCCAAVGSKALSLSIL